MAGRRRKQMHMFSRRRDKHRERRRRKEEGERGRKSIDPVHITHHPYVENTKDACKTAWPNAGERRRERQRGVGWKRSGRNAILHIPACHFAPWERKKTLTIAGVSGGDLGQVSVVIALHLQVEDFALGIAGFGDQVLVQQTLQRKNCNFLEDQNSINQSINDWLQC